ncbi:MAG: flavodoxin [Clostridia bacterium]|nr:flavodoxin [Clostridia bacterium]
MSRKLVAYFSASGVTAKLAEQLSEAIGADLHEIRAKEQYSQADLDWRNDKSRSSIEMKNKTFRPEIVDDKISISEYDTVFVGFPIWWYVAPTIINTFLESHDFSGKTVVVFATSGSSDFGNTINELKISLPDSTKLIEGKVLNGKYTNKELSDWAESIGV